MTRRSMVIQLGLLGTVLSIGTCGCCLWWDGWGWGRGVAGRGGLGGFRGGPIVLPIPGGGSSRVPAPSTSGGRGGFGSTGSGHVGS